MDVTMDISGDPPPEELNARAVTLFNQTFALEPSVDALQVSLQHMSSTMTNCVYIVIIDPEPIVPTAHAPRTTRAIYNNHNQNIAQMLRKYILHVYGTGINELLSRRNKLF
ncbi:hypothetical protein GGI23_002836 [Coemansia sp. RSA 2559]|nr:hypothetical protein GGI23_002836 [Coemansia sp. RSA 2559]